MTKSLMQEVRTSCRKVSEQAVHVKIDQTALADYAAALPSNRLLLPEMDPTIHYLGHGPETLAYYLTLDAINFGSGYFPEVFGDSRRSGYRAIAAALTEHFTRCGPIPAKGLRRLSSAECAEILHLDPCNPAVGELTMLYAQALNQLGAFVDDRFGGKFTGVVAKAGESVQRLVELLITMPLFNDVALYQGMSVAFYKRAQLLAVDLSIAFGGEGLGRFIDVDQIAICADNLVPHVLRLDGVLRYREELAQRIDRGEPLAAGSLEEVEIRACAVYAGELIVANLRDRGEKVNAMMLDNFLWHRGQEQLYRARPRHRTRTVYY